MNGQRVRGTAIIMTAALLCAGCGDSGNAARSASAPGTSVAASPVEPAQPPASAVQTPPPLPQERPASGETAPPQDDALRPMTKDEEADSMPRPKQANDHSTPSPPQDPER